MAVFMLKKIKPRFSDDLWLRAIGLTKKLKAKNNPYEREQKQTFIDVVSELYSKLEDADKQ